MIKHFKILGILLGSKCYKLGLIFARYSHNLTIIVVNLICKQIAIAIIIFGFINRLVPNMKYEIVPLYCITLCAWACLGFEFGHLLSIYIYIYINDGFKMTIKVMAAWPAWDLWTDVRIFSLDLCFLLHRRDPKISSSLMTGGQVSSF